MAKGPAEIALGPMLIGTAFDILLQGVMISQVYSYLTLYRKDRNWLKCLVCFLLLADTVDAVFVIVYVYDALIIHFANVDYLAKATWVFATNSAMTSIISSAVQFFYAWRVKVVTGKIWVVLIITVSACISMLAGIGTAIAVMRIPTFVEFVKFKVIVIIWLVSAVVGDICITASLTYHLKKHKTGFAATDDAIDRVIQLTVQTGAITSLCATLGLTIFLADATGTHLIFNIPLSKLYTISMMSSLNARGGWKFSNQSGGAASEAHRSGAGPRSRSDVVKLQSLTKPKIFVHVEQHEHVDAHNNKGPNHLFPDAELDPAYHDRQPWEDGDVKNQPQP